VAADVVDYLGAGFDGETSGGGVKGVYRDEGAGLCLEDGFDCGKDTGLFFVRREWNRVGAGGFAADVEDIGTFLEHLESLGYGAIGGGLWCVEVATVGEGVGGNVEDAHDDRPLAER